ncbi:DUF6794 domain-containing protein [Flavobacterium solisilvae]|uniref:DUF6794 domain-containing protein n=1 Tax=Flavobacterium solisilvae TaxID=1852019 RepID=A0ABX1QPR3_9FLAO|nr:DUF6794 domain-containing protein [Flavobacterium solisilvae]NMH24216.1 hypothetical protein [Flavobacterium solisilvae]
MRTTTIILFLFISNCFSQNDCNRYSNDYIPKNLIEALNYLDCKWSKNDKDIFKNKEEQDAVSEIHFSTGLNIRNSWGLWGKRRNSLKRYFIRKGVFHPDDISSIILTSFHRHINNKEIGLDEQIKHYKEYWKKAKVKKEKEIQAQEIESRNEFESFKISDSVKIAYNLHENKTIWAYRIQKYPDLNEVANCYVSGIVTRKKTKLKKRKYILYIKVTDMCGYNDAIQNGIENNRLSLNKEYDFSLMNYKITKVQNNSTNSDLVK